MIARVGRSNQLESPPQGPVATHQGAWHQRIDDNPLTAQIPGLSQRKIRLGPTFHTVSFLYAIPSIDILQIIFQRSAWLMGLYNCLARQSFLRRAVALALSIIIGDDRRLQTDRKPPPWEPSMTSPLRSVNVDHVYRLMEAVRIGGELDMEKLLRVASDIGGYAPETDPGHKPAGRVGASDDIERFEWVSR